YANRSGRSLRRHLSPQRRILPSHRSRPQRRRRRFHSPHPIRRLSRLAFSIQDRRLGLSLPFGVGGLSPTSALQGKGFSPEEMHLRFRTRSAQKPHSQFQFANCSLTAVFLNFPTLVRGIASTNTNASGNCHLAKHAPRNCRSSSGVAEWPSFST